MVIFIHGFGSSGQSNKARLFRDYFKAHNIPYIAPSLSFIPDLAISTLEELINSYDDVKLMGSSLGGYYALYLSQKYNLKSVLINPSIHPKETLKRHLKDYATAYFDGSHFLFRENHIQMLERYDTQEKILDSNYLLLLQKGDDILDYQEAIAKLPNALMVVEEGGSHQFDGIERHIKKIVDFFGV